ncbi:MAG: glycoside hydrolase 100 family protein [Halothiobacillaceae bacterium]
MDRKAYDPAATLEDAYQLLEQSLLHYDGKPVGTIASLDPRAPAENYRDCFVRDFVSAGFVLLLDGRGEVVRDFLALILRLRGQQEELEGQQLAPGVLPASFKVVTLDNGAEEIFADFGDRAIGRVAPVDSMMWWAILLRAYVSSTGDTAFAHTPEVQRGLRMILSLCLQSRFEVFPTLLVPDGSFMIDRRMGVNGHPIEIQALFDATLDTADLLVQDEANRWLVELSHRRRHVLREYVRRYYWLDMDALNRIHRFNTEMFGHEVDNVFNIYPESIPGWVADWVPDEAGYLLGNVGPGRMDFRFFSQGNLLAALFGLADESQTAQIMRTFEQRWDDLVGLMPLKIVYPAIENHEWRLMTGSDPKNTPWSYHNGGNWPVLVWPFVAAALRAGRRDLAERVVASMERRAMPDAWAEYYDGRHGRLIGRRANLHQVWSATGYILAIKLLEAPENLAKLGLTKDDDE